MSSCATNYFRVIRIRQNKMGSIIPLIAIFLVSFILVGISGPKVFKREVPQSDASDAYNANDINYHAPIRDSCKPKITSEIEKYSKVIKQIVDYVVNGAQKGKTYDDLAKFVDKFGSRIAGSQNLEVAIDYMVNLMNVSGLENVHTEPAMVPHWVRGNESASMVIPRVKKLAMMGLGGSIGTPNDGITAEVLVVKSFDDLKAKAEQAKGKIVVYDEDYVSYGQTVSYRQFAAVEAAKLGGVAALVRSITPYSINSPHTGWQDYADNVTNIPVACITIEDAEMLWRIAQRGEKIVINLKMEAQNLPPVTSRNTIGELQGKTYKDQIVMVSGHLDSWDVGQGAMDDGAGAFISWRSLSILKELGLRPKRTMRAVLWTGEEEGLWGAQAYFNAHKAQNDNFSLVMESDIGTFTPLGLTFSGTNEDAKCAIRSLVEQFAFMNASRVDFMAEGSDTSLWIQAGIPGSSLINDNDKYFYYHHSDGDTMTVEDSHTLDLCTAFWAATAYVVADLNDLLPR